MQLNVREAARLLNLPETTVDRLARQGRLPSSTVHDQVRFNRAELLEWANSQRTHVSPELFGETPSAVEASLAAALRAGGIHRGVAGADPAAALEAVVGLMPLPDENDRPFLLQMLLARERLASTGVGGGIALPHARNPIVMHVPGPWITLCFLQQPIEFGAVDGLPVHTLFTIVSPTTRAHLNLLARLSFALRQPSFAAAVSSRAAAKILAAAEKIDAGLAHPSG